MSEDNLVSRVLQQSPELVKRKLKACEVRMDNTKPLNWDCYIKMPICEVDPQLMRFVKEHCALQAKLDIAIEALEKYALQSHWWDCEDKIKRVLTNGNGTVSEGCFGEKGYKLAQEALAKIKEIK